ncbi:repetitive organellar protein-like [Linepithema humile]|uniref:repetitive organellar protein-like n=1 Tax=Linepithema humile TaxID=83485 RepID=UPI00351F768D
MQFRVLKGLVNAVICATRHTKHKGIALAADATEEDIIGSIKEFLRQSIGRAKTWESKHKNERDENLHSHISETEEAFSAISESEEDEQNETNTSIDSENNNDMADKLKRRENFSQEEKDTIVEFIRHNSAIMEDKSASAKLQVLKKQKWKELAEQMKATGSQRKWEELRAAYQRWKTKTSTTVMVKMFMLLEKEDLSKEQDEHNISTTAQPSSSSLVRLHSDSKKLNEPAPKKRKKEMSAYEEALLEFQKEKHLKTMELMQIEHEAKIKAILAEQKQK